jgi:hypothetical protein
MSKLRGWILCGLLLSGGAGAAAIAGESRVMTGTVTNTTHDVSAPVTIELVFEGDNVSGWLTTEAPLQAGRWPITGVRKGAWCEVICHQAPETRTHFRGVLGATEYRGTYVFSGKNEQAQYGRFHAKAPKTP